VIYLVRGPRGDVQVELTELADARYHVRVAAEGETGKEYDVRWSAALGRLHRVLEWDGRRRLVVVEPEAEALGVTIGADHYDLRVEPVRPVRRRGDGPAAPATVEVRAPMPGLIVALEVTPGQAVGPGGTVAVIEAMKMQMELRAPAGGIVRQLRVAAGQEVAAGEVIVVLAAGGEGASGL